MKLFRSNARDRGRSGVALLYAVLAAFLAASLVVLMMSVSLVSDQASDRKQRTSQAQYLAEGAIEAGKKALQTAIADWDPVPTGGSITIEGHDATYTIRATGFETTLTDVTGLETLVRGFEIEGAAVVSGTRARSFRIVHSEATPLFQYAAFYAHDLEILPGPSMHLSGRVHSNRDLYLGSNDTLTLDSNYVRCVGNLYRNRKDDPSISPGTVDIRRWVVNPWNPAEPVAYQTLYSRTQLETFGVSSDGGYDSAFAQGFDANGNGEYTDPGDFLPFGPGALDLWAQPASYASGAGHTLQTAQHAVGESVVPRAGSIAAFEPQAGGNYVYDSGAHEYVACPAGTGTHSKGYYHAHADLTILVSPSGANLSAYDADGVDLTAALASAVSLREIHDARQADGGAGDVPIVDVDVQALHASGVFPENGLLYVTHKSASTGTNARGVRLRNAAVLEHKLTVVSQDPLYIQGNYNVGDASHPKVGAAVIADAVSLLSSAWDDSKSATSSLPAATSTTYNVAMVAGNLDTSEGHYNGGLENLPRFHEDWTGVTCALRGSLVNLWDSEHATEPWVYGGNRYQAPVRQWTYDTAFNSVLNLPPFTPMSVSARDVVSW